jgi:small subunit ribosomal protein S6
MQRDYELVLLLHPDLEIDLEKPLAKVRKLIADAKGDIVKEENWGKRKLAYKIKGEEFAVYVSLEVKLPAETARKLQDTLNISDEVLRYLLTAIDLKERAAREAAKAEAEAKGQEEDKAKEEE